VDATIAIPLFLVLLGLTAFFNLAEMALEGSNGLILHILGIRPGSEDAVTQGEIRRILSEGVSAGTLLSFERSMMEHGLDLDRRSVRTVMTGRRDIQTPRLGMDGDTLKAAVLAMTASRLPVTEATDLDRLVGIVSRADVLTALARGETVDVAALTMSGPFASP